MEPLGRVFGYLIGSDESRVAVADAPAHDDPRLSEHLLVCTVDSLRSASGPAGLTVAEVSAGSSVAQVQENLDVNARGFDPAAPAITEAEAAQFQQAMDSSLAFTAHVDGAAVAAGMILPIRGGVTELVGITTLTPHRGRGIAGHLTATMAASAFDKGATLAFLTTGDDDVRRVYQRAGFAQIGFVLSLPAEYA